MSFRIPSGRDEDGRSIVQGSGPDSEYDRRGSDDEDPPSSGSSSTSKRNGSSTIVIAVIGLAIIAQSCNWITNSSSYGGTGGEMLLCVSPLLLIGGIFLFVAIKRVSDI